MKNEMPINQQPDGEIDLRELSSVVWAGRKVIFMITGIFAALALISALLSPNQYQATVVVYPLEDGPASLMGSMASQIGGIASLAGISVGGAETLESKAAMEVMLSWGFIDKFIKKNKLAADIFAADGWDRETNQLSYDASIYDSKEKKWVRDAPKDKTINPTSWELYTSFSERLIVSKDIQTGMVSVSIEHYSPLLARQWVEMFIVDINDYMREKKLVESNRNIMYLEKQLDETAIAGIKEIIYMIIEEQVKGRMLAESSPEYAFTTISPAMLPEEISSPHRMLNFIVSIILGLIISIFALLVRYFIKRPSEGEDRG